MSTDWVKSESMVLDSKDSASAQSDRSKSRARVDQLLSELTQGGSSDHIFEEIYAFYADAIFLFFLRRNFSPEDSHDLRQETFLNLFRGIHSFAGQSSFDTWLFGIAANLWRNRLRAGSALRRSGKEISLAVEENRAAVEQSVPSKNEQEALLVEKEMKARLARALECLPPKMRQCAILRFQQNLKYQEIAELTGISLTTVKAHIHQARHRLRGQLADLLDS